MKYPFAVTVKTELLSWIIILASIVCGFYFYQHFPAVVVGHWNLSGEPNGYIPKFWGAFLIPFFLIGIYCLFMILPLIDPKRDHYVSFARSYQFMRTIVLATLFIIFLATGFYNIGFHIQIKFFVSIAIGLMMIVIGSYLGTLKPNWFIGIRTPWTLSSEKVWQKTHELGRWMFILFGLLLITLPFLSPVLMITVFIIGILLVTALPITYSYLIFKKEEKR